jgi:hypothetical protein
MLYLSSARVGLERPIQKPARYGRQPKVKLTKPVRNTKATEVEPPFVADVEYRDVTSEGLLWQNSPKALPEIGQAVCCGRTTPSSQSCSLANANQLSDIRLKRLRAG